MVSAPVKSKVLVVHDNPTMRTLISRLLMEHQCFVEIDEDLSQKIDDLDFYTLVIIGLQPALESLDQLLKKERSNLIVFLPFESLTLRDAKIYKIERVKGKIMEMPATQEALLSILRIAIKD